MPVRVYRYLTVFLVILVAVFVFNPLHELGHYKGFAWSGIPSCMKYNVTDLSESPAFDPKYIPGLIGGPAANFLLGAFFVVLYTLAPLARHLRLSLISQNISLLQITLALLAATMLLLRAWLFLGGLLLGSPADEVQLLHNLKTNHGMIVALTGTFSLVFGPLVVFALFWIKLGVLDRWQKLLVPLFVLFAIQLVFWANEWFNIDATPLIGPIGGLC